MRYGVTIFCTDVSIQPVELAVALQERGFDTMWVPEHTHIPTSRRTPYPNGGELPDEYKRCHDPFVALAAASIAVPTRRPGAATDAAASATNGSWHRLYSSGSSPPLGYGVRRLVGDRKSVV